MNSNHRILFIALAALLSFTGCKKDTASKTTAGHYLSASSASIGSFHSSSSVIAAGASGAKITITAEATTGARLTLYINPYAGTVGVIPLGPGSETGGLYRTSSGSAPISSTSGNITITAVTPDIIGTFNYVATDGSTFTGSFNVAAP
jgi:hypothetical protein